MASAICPLSFLAWSPLYYFLFPVKVFFYLPLHIPYNPFYSDQIIKDYSKQKSDTICLIFENLDTNFSEQLTYKEFDNAMRNSWYLNDGRGTIQGFICE